MTNTPAAAQKPPHAVARTQGHTHAQSHARPPDRMHTRTHDRTIAQLHACPHEKVDMSHYLTSTFFAVFMLGFLVGTMWLTQIGSGASWDEVKDTYWPVWRSCVEWQTCVLS